MGLFDDPFISLQMGVLSSGVISPSGAVIDLVAEKMQLSSIIEKKVFDIEGKKIGYLFYSDFFGGSEKELNEVFHWFQEEGVGDVVLDLRYNPGGYVNVATHLSSILAPMDVVNSEKVLVTYQWNAGYQAYWEQEKQYARLRTVFNKSVPVNMNLQRLYVFTTSSSASASELVITGLDPYMEVIKIGGASHGKYTGSSLFRPETYNGKTWEVDQEIKNWGILPIIFRYANSLGITNFKNGFTPDYIVPDLLLEGVQQLGDPNEPFLGKALELISGINFSVHAPTTKSGFEMRVDLLPKKDYFHGSVFVKMD
jgi:C-terminal processing protease CtpA/Prc